MGGKRVVLALLVAVLWAAAVAPSSSAAKQDVSGAGLVRHSPGDESGDNAEAENPGDDGNPDDVGNPSQHEESGEEGDESGKGADQSGNGDSCTSVSSVTVCFDQPRN